MKHYLIEGKLHIWEAGPCVCGITYSAEMGWWFRLSIGRRAVSLTLKFGW